MLAGFGYMRNNNFSLFKNAVSEGNDNNAPVYLNSKIPPLSQQEYKFEIHSRKLVKQSFLFAYLGSLMQLPLINKPDFYRVYFINCFELNYMTGTLKVPWVKVFTPGPAPLLAFTGPEKVPITLVAVMLVIMMVKVGI